MLHGGDKVPGPMNTYIRILMHSIHDLVTSHSASAESKESRLLTFDIFLV